MANFQPQGPQRELMRGLERGLRLSHAEQKALSSEVHPITWAEWMVSVFSDDEKKFALELVDPYISPLSPAVQALLGKEITIDEQPSLALAEGVLAQRVRALYEKGDPVARTRFTELSTSCAQYMVALGRHALYRKELQELMPAFPQTQVRHTEQDKAYLFFAADPPVETAPLGFTAKSVVTYGPGLTGGLLAGELIGRTEVLHLVSAGVGAEFLEQLATGQLRQMEAHIASLPREEIAKMSRRPLSGSLQLPEAHFHNDGITRSIGVIASRSVERGRPIDVVLMSAVHSAGRDECLAGIEGAFELLGEGRVLAVKAPRESLGDEAGMDVVMPEAVRLFGQPTVTGECGTLMQYHDSSLPAGRPADYAIFQKQ